MDYVIKKAEIGYLKNGKKTGIVQNNMTVFNLEKEVIDEKICFIIDGKAIDIENFDNIYEVIKRNKYKQILPSQKIDEQKIYALELKELTKEDLTLLKKSKYEKRAKQYKKMNR